MSESSPREPGVRGLQGPTSGFRRPSQVCRDYRLVTTLVFVCAYGADYRPTRSSR